MGIAEMNSRKAVLAAVKEFNELGRDRFLEKYGFWHAKSYFLEVDGVFYASKAILGVAYGYEFSKPPLRSEDFNGGEPVKHKLEQLGFRVVVRRTAA